MVLLALASIEIEEDCLELAASKFGLGHVHRVVPGSDWLFLGFEFSRANINQSETLHRHSRRHIDIHVLRRRNNYNKSQMDRVKH